MWLLTHTEMMMIAILAPQITNGKDKNSIVQVNRTAQQNQNIQFGLLIIWNHSLLQKPSLKNMPDHVLLQTTNCVANLFAAFSLQPRSLISTLGPSDSGAAYSQLAISSWLVSPAASSDHVTDANNNNKCSQRTTNSNCHCMAFSLFCWCCFRAWIGWLCRGVAFLHYSRENRKTSQDKNSWSSSCMYSDHTH